MLSRPIQEILKSDPEIARAVAEVDRGLIRASLRRSPMERLKTATSHIRALRRFRRVSSPGS